MKAFAELYSRLDASTSNSAKKDALQHYFQTADGADAAWAVYFLAGGKPRQLVPSKLLRQLVLDGDALPEWMFEECYQAVGDLAETISLLLPASTHQSTEALAVWIEQRLLPLHKLPAEALQAQLRSMLQMLDPASQLVLIKLITGAFRVGVSKLSVIRALAAISGVDAKRIAQRMVGYTDSSAKPSSEAFLRLIAPSNELGDDRRDPGQPYPFFLAHPISVPQSSFDTALGAPSAWQVEWKWDGIRAQVVKRDGRIWVWSRGEELITERFPEFGVLAQQLADGTVIDGEIVVWKNDAVQPFVLLQQRIGRKTLSTALLAKIPVVLLAYDLLEWQGQDLRMQPQHVRRAQLEKIVAGQLPPLRISPLVQGDSWQALAMQREQSRRLGVEGLMLKQQQSCYGVGRTKTDGIWWKWKIDPYVIDAVLIYAQKGHGRRASLYTDFTFALWDDSGEGERKLVPFAKAYSGLTDEQMQQVDAVIRKTTIEKFGPVRSVTPTMVFELGFEGISRSPRHKSGIAVRFPRILRWRKDKALTEADTLASLQDLLTQAEPPSLVSEPTRHGERS